MEPITSFPNPGAIPSQLDYRSNIVALASSPPIPVALPPGLFTNFQKLGIYYQRQTPSCVSHAQAQLMKLWWYTKTGQIVNFSARFLHAISKGVSAPDKGRDPLSVAKLAMKYGCATEATCPNDTRLSDASYMNIQLTPAMMKEAAQYKIPGFVQIPVTQYGFREAIMRYGAVSMLIRIGDSFWKNKAGTPSWTQSEIDPVRPPNPIVGSHQVVGSGWSGGLDHFVNSWSSDWAQQGESDYIWNEWYKYVVEAIAIADIPGSILQLIQGLPPANEFVHDFTKAMGYGDSSDEVRALQIALSIDGEGVYPEITGFYGTYTRQAVLQFQIKYNVAPLEELQSLNGRSVGPRTRVKLNALYGKKVGNP